MSLQAPADVSSQLFSWRASSVYRPVRGQGRLSRADGDHRPRQRGRIHLGYSRRDGESRRQATTWYVEYGTSTSYGRQTTSRSAGSGTANVQVSAPSTGLAPSTTYHYRLVGTNGAGTSHGADGIFTTTSGPVAVTGSVSAITTGSATSPPRSTRTGGPRPGTSSTGRARHTARRRRRRAPPPGTASVGVSAAVSGLAAGRVYHYRIVATSDAGTSHGADRTFTTAGAPVAVTGSASAITTRSARLAGTVNPNGQATSWYFEYGATTGYGSKTSTKSAGSGTRSTGISITITGFEDGDGVPLPPRRDELVRTNVGADRVFGTAGPPIVRTGTAVELGPTSARPTGSVNPQGRRTTWYFEYGTTTRYGSRTAARSAGSTFGDQSVAALLTPLRTAVTYHYRIVARNDAGTTRGADLRLHHHRRLAQRPRPQGRLRTCGDAVRPRPDETAGRDGDAARPGLRIGLAEDDRDGADRRGRPVALLDAPDDPDGLYGELERCDEPRDGDRRAAGRVLPTRGKSAFHNASQRRGRSQGAS